MEGGKADVGITHKPLSSHDERGREREARGRERESGSGWGVYHSSWITREISTSCRCCDRVAFIRERERERGEREREYGREAEGKGKK